MKKLFSALALVLPIACWAQVSSTNGNFTATTPSNLSLQTQVGTTTTTRLTIRSSGATAGFVGVNTTSPADWFHVNGNIRANQINSVTGIVNTTSSTVGLSFRTNNTARMTIKPDGNLGIGTTNPLNKLQIGPNPNGWVTNDFVVANGNGGLAISTNATETYLWGSTDIAIRPGNGVEAIYAKSDGNVGIGTATPAYRLDVNGTLNATSILVGGQPISGGSSLWASDGVNTYIPTGNIGIGTTAPGAKLSFGQIENEGGGLAWSDSYPLNYGIYRTAGPWSAPDYQQLQLNWLSGIVLNPGDSYPKSYVDVQGGGLRVSSGNVVIGTPTPNPAYKLDVAGTINATGILVNGVDVAAGSSIWSRTTGNTIVAQGIAGSFTLDLRAMPYGNSVLSLSSNSGGSAIIKASKYGSEAKPLVFQTNDAERMRIDGLGNVGIGKTAASAYKLDVAGTINATGILVNGAPISGGSSQWVTTGSNISYSAGSVGIGTTSPGSYKLAVEGKIGAREVNVTTAAWSDYVFDKEFKLLPLEKLKEFIDKNHHLPDVPTEQEVLKNGQDLGAMNAVLLKKIEELTLYMIEMKKENDSMKKEVNSLKERQSK